MTENWMLSRLEKMADWEEAKKLVCYEVWGVDRFAQERYPCGVYAHRESAEKQLAKLQEAQKGEEDNLPDDYWIRETTWLKHLTEFDQDAKRKREIKELIKWHTEYLAEEIPHFREFALQCPRTPGLYKYPMKRKGSYIKYLALNIAKLNRSRKYEFTIGIYFKETWESARFTACYSPLRAETLRQIAALELTDKMFEGYLEKWQDQIWKFFTGSY